MTSLDRNLRKDLEKTVRQARRVAETGAAKAVAQLGVGDAEVSRHLSADQRALRNRLRAHGRQLGDRRDTRTGAQDTARLIQECAYEHWHRMLFARFLAEADLLIEPESAVAISLAEVQELAREKATDWLELASGYAEQMLPQIFRKDDPVLKIALPPETRSELEDLLKGLPRAVFEADDSLGWVYQFWQADKKDEVNKSERKIGADELPAVTQLFTEDYMVLFLLHNTLGAWWAGKVLAANPALAATAKTEDELRRGCKVGDIEWTYLRFVRDKGDDGPWRPAAGTFGGWPKEAKDITVLDPCMGSGHFLVFALPILVAIRMAEEGLSHEAAVEAVLRDNLFGLEIDQRCTQIAAFNLAFAAWRTVGYRPLPRLNLACSGLAIAVTKAEWLRLAEKAVTAVDPVAKRDLLGVEKSLLTVGLEERVKNGLSALYDLFAKAPWLGSLTDPRGTSGDVFRADFAQLKPLLGSIFSAAETDDIAEMAVAAQGITKAAELLIQRFSLVMTNVPYLARGKQDAVLQEYCEQMHPAAKADLATCFVERCLSFCTLGGCIGIVTPQNWFFQISYSRFRKNLLKQASLSFIGELGMAAFQIMDWWAFNTALIVASNEAPSESQLILSIDAKVSREPSKKADDLREVAPAWVSQISQLRNPDSRLSLSEIDTSRILGRIARAHVGFQNGDTPRFVRQFWEFDALAGDNAWRPIQMPPQTTGAAEGLDSVLSSVFESGEGSGFWHGQSADSFGKVGVLVRNMGRLPVTRYFGGYFDQSATALTCDETMLPALWSFTTSTNFHDAVRQIEPKVNVTPATFEKVSIELPFWQKVASETLRDGLPPPISDEPTSWIFCGDPRRTVCTLQVASARLVGFRWPRQTGSSFRDCPAIGPDGLEKHADADGIVCLTAAKGEAPAHERLTALLADAFVTEWSAAKLASLLAEVGFAGESLDDWLRDGFFEQHCALFHQRPFVWHVWDGRRDGFHALVNYHRLAAPDGEGRRTLEKLIYYYLGDWIDRRRAEQKAGVEGADARLAHAEHLRAELIKILEGEPPYDIFARWKPLREQPIGWDPDINDGVRMNIRPFMTARPLKGGGKNGCILRVPPRIKWDKDRGKEPKRDKVDYPWFWGWDGVQRDFPGGAEFDGNRWNDLHYSRAAKQAARDRHRAKTGAKS